MAERASGTARASDCRNCGESLCGPYCHSCGESHVHRRLELRALFDELVNWLVNPSTPLLRTLGELTINPGWVGRDYLTGRRKAYINPLVYAVAMFLLVAVVNQALISMHGIPDEPGLARLSQFTFSWGLAIELAVLPVFALCLYGLFYGGPRAGGALGAPRQLEWIEHLVLALFGLGHVALLVALLAPFLPYLGGVGAPLVLGVAIVYCSWLCVGVYRTPWWSTLPRVAVAVIAGIQVPAGLLGHLIAPGLL